MRGHNCDPCAGFTEQHGFTERWTWFFYRDMCNIYYCWRRSDWYRSWKGLLHKRKGSRANNSTNKDGTQCKLCACGECMHISYRLYPVLPAPISVCPCETKCWLERMDFEQLLRKQIFILWLTACAVPLAMECFIHQ